MYMHVIYLVTVTRIVNLIVICYFLYISLTVTLFAIESACYEITVTYNLTSIAIFSYYHMSIATTVFIPEASNYTQGVHLDIVYVHVVI